jgi:Protein of unknown function (DUF3349)
VRNDLILVLVVITALAFDFTNGFHDAITMVTDHTASDADVARVRSRLAAGGWPLAKPEHFNPANWP